MFLLLSLLAVTLVSSECEDMPNWGCEDIQVVEEDCNGLKMKKCLKSCNQCPEEASAEEPECADMPNWGCEDIQVVEEDCNGLKMKKCMKSCGQCGGDEASAESEEPANECTETFDPVCEVCADGEDCDGMLYKITTKGEGSMGRFGCTYPENYEFVNSGTGCPEIKADCAGLGCADCIAVPNYGCSFAGGADFADAECYPAGEEPMDAKSFAFSAANCPAEKPSCAGLGCADCLAVPDYGCSFAGGAEFADAACYPAGEEPMDAKSFAFSTTDCPADEESGEPEEPEKPSCAGLGCADCLAVPDYGCSFAGGADFADAACYSAGEEPMDSKSFAFSTTDCPADAESGEPEEPAPVCSLESCVEACYCPEGKKPRCRVGENSGCTDAVNRGTKTYPESLIACRSEECESEESPEPESPESEESPEPEEVEDCTCGIGAVKGEENFQSGATDGTKMCQFGTNCATFFEGCDGKGATVCNLKIEYAEVVEDCTCGIGAVKGEEKFQSGSVDGTKMCQFGANCATFFEGCDGKGATVCNLKIEYVEPASVESMESVESEESAEPEVTCSAADCLKPCKGRKKKSCQVGRDSKCEDKKAKGKGKKQKFYSFAACKTAETFAAYEAPTASPTTEDYLIYSFALVGLVVLTRTTFVLAKRMTAGRYELVEEYDLEL